MENRHNKDICYIPARSNLLGTIPSLEFRMFGFRFSNFEYFEKKYTLLDI